MDSNDSKAYLAPLTTLVPDARNARTHDERQIAQIKASIREFGFTAPILIDEENNILAGHGRWEAAHQLKLEEVPVRKITGLTKAQKRAFIIADNKIASNAKWNEDLLKLEIEELQKTDFNCDLLGFESWELTHLFDPAAAWRDEIDGIDGLSETDEEGNVIIRVKCVAADKPSLTKLLENAISASPYADSATLC
jgi:hypothetical protein